MLLLLASLACALQAQQIMDLLTRAPMRSLEPETQVLLWPNSVLDEATERAHPCMQFVAHAHCQSVLSEYYHGNFVGSQAAIPRAHAKGALTPD